MLPLYRRPTTYTLPIGLALIIVAHLVPDIRELLWPDWANVGLDSWALRSVWALSLVFIAVGLVLAAYDGWRLAQEWWGLKQIATKKRPPSRSIIAARAAEVSDWKARHGKVPPPTRWFDSLRVQAATALDSVGATSRFIAGSLLLLAIIGTFAGMKAALPELTRAIQQVQAGAEVPRLGTALNYVQEAFGVNFVALLGSLSLGIIAFGASTERRHVLQYVEAASDQYLYELLGHGLDATSLDTAVRELHEGVSHLSTVADKIDSLNSGLSSYTGVLRDTLSEVRLSFTSGLRDEMTHIFTMLQSRMDATATDLHDVAVCLSSTALAYEGLSQGLAERHEDLAAAGKAFSDTGGQIVEKLSTIASEIEAANKSAHEKQEHLYKKGDAVADEIWAARQSLSAVMTKFGESLGALEQHLDAAGKAMTDATGRDKIFFGTLLKLNQELAGIFQQAQRATDASLMNHTALIEKRLTASDQMLRELVTRQQEIADTYSKGIETLQGLGSAISGRMEKSMAIGSSAFEKSMNEGTAAIDKSLAVMKALQDSIESAQGASLNRSRELTEILNLHLTRAEEASKVTGGLLKQLQTMQQRLDSRSGRRWWQFSRS